MQFIEQSCRIAVLIYVPSVQNIVQTTMTIIFNRLCTLWIKCDFRELFLMQPQSFSICRNVVHSLVVCINMISAEKVIFQIVSSIILETASCFCWIWCSSTKTGFITRERNGMICVLKFSRARFVYWSKTMLMLFVVIASASNYFLLLCALLFWR